MPKLARFLLPCAAALAFCACGGVQGPAVPPVAATPVAPVTPAPTVRYSVSGNVTGLQGLGLVLVNNAADPTPITRNGDFTLAASLVNGATYLVTVSTQPTGPAQECSVVNGSGTLSGANVTNLAINCVTPTVPGTRLGYQKQVRGADNQFHEELFDSLPDGRDERQLTRDSTSLYVGTRWSRNGRFIAYCKPDLTTSIRDRSCQLFLRDGDGGNERFVDFGGEPSFSEDSTRLLYIRTYQTSTLTQERLFMMDLVAGTTTQVLAARGGPDVLNAVVSSIRMRNPVFDPATREAVYFGHLDDLHGADDPDPKLHRQIFQVQYPGLNSTFALALSAEAKCNPYEIPNNLWTSPRGFLYFSCGARLWEVALVSGVQLGARQVPGFNNPQDLAFAASPDGDAVAVSDSSRVLVYKHDFDPATVQFSPINGLALRLGGWFSTR
jgi:hypothetical protein